MNPLGTLVELESTRGLKAERGLRKLRREDVFARVHLLVACRVNRCHPNALITYLALRVKADTRQVAPYVLGDEFLAESGILPKSRDRALAALETAGFVRVERSPGRLPRIWLLDG